MSMYSGFATGLRAGSGLVTQALENERASAKEERDEEDYKEKQATRDRLNQAWGAVPKYGLQGPASSQAIPEDYQTPGDASAAPPTTPATSPATGPGAGPASGPSGAVPPVSAGGIPAPAVAAPTDDGTAAAPVAGTPGAALGAPAAPAAPAAAAPPAAPQMSEAMQQARQMYNVAVASRDMNAVTTARSNIEQVDQREIAGTIGKMTPEEVAAYVQKNVNTGDGLPLAVTQLGPGKYRLTTWGKDGVGRESLLNGAQAQQLALSHALMEKYPDKGMALAASINKDLDATVKEYNTETGAQNRDANTAVHDFNQDAVAQGQLGVSQARLGMEQQKAKAESTEMIGATKDGVINRNKATGGITIAPFPEGLPDDAKQQFIKKYRTDYEPKISPDGQMMTVGTKTYDRNTNYNSKTADPTKVNTVDAWIETTRARVAT